MQDFIEWIKNKLDHKDIPKEILTLERKLTAALAEAKDGENGEKQHLFVGEKAKTADKLKLSTAEQMEKDGADSETIRKETGWHKGYDGKWRFEIDDSMIKINKTGALSENSDTRRYLELFKKAYIECVATANEMNELAQLDEKLSSKNAVPNTLGELLQHNELFEAYPQLKDIAVILDDIKDVAKGVFNERLGLIILNKDLTGKQLKDTLLHEIQHVVQNIEGMADGSSPSYWGRRILNDAFEKRDKIRNELRKESEKGTDIMAEVYMYDVYIDRMVSNGNISASDFARAYDRFAKEISGEKSQELFWDYAEATEKYYNARENIRDTSYKAYEATAGEIEARDTTNRANFTAEQRKNTRPDIDRTDVVFANNSSESMEIVTLDNGKQYVRASERQVIKGGDPQLWKRQIAKYINRELRNWNDFDILTVEGDVLTLTRDTAYKAGSINQIRNQDGTYRTMTQDEYLTKLNAEVHINELAQVSKKIKKPNVPDSKNHRFAKNGFSYRTAYFQDYDGKYYKITLSVGENGNNSTVYNVGKLKKDTLPNGIIVSVFSGSKADSVSNNRISQSEPVVNSILRKKSKKDTKNLSDVSDSGKQRSFSLDNSDDVQPNYDLLDRYTDKTYNDYGWVAVNNVLTKNEWAQYNRKLRETLSSNTAKNVRGERIMTVGEHSSDITALVYVNGTASNPVVTKVVKINRSIKNNVFISDVLEELMKYDRQGYREPSRYVESVYGERLFDEHKSSDFKSLSQLQGERKGSFGDKGQADNRDFKIGAGSLEENNGTIKAGVENTSAFSDGKQYSFTEDGTTDENIALKAADLTHRYRNGEITTDEYARQQSELWEKANEQYGSIEKGEKPKADVDVPKTVDGTYKTRRFARTALEADIGDRIATEQVRSDILTGKLAYKTLSDQVAIKHAEDAIRNGTAESKWAQAYAEGRFDKNTVAIGEALMRMYAERHDNAKLVNILSEIAEVGTTAGQTVQAMSLLKDMDGVSQLVYVRKVVDRLNNNLEKRYKNKKNVPHIELSDVLVQPWKIGCIIQTTVI